jgi:hypothetical protein
MHRIFDLTKRRVGMGQTPFFHSAEHFFTQFSPALFVI